MGAFKWYFWAKSNGWAEVLSNGIEVFHGFLGSKQMVGWSGRFQMVVLGFLQKALERFKRRLGGLLSSVLGHPDGFNFFWFK